MKKNFLRLFIFINTEFLVLFESVNNSEKQKYDLVIQYFVISFKITTTIEIISENKLDEKRKTIILALNYVVVVDIN